MIDQWRSSAKNLIYHFRCVKSGISPFLFATKLEAGTRSDLGPEALQYIDRVREHLKHNSELQQSCASKDYSSHTLTTEV